MVRVLLDAAQAVDLGEDDGERAPHGEVAERDRRGARAEERAELVADALTAHARQAGRGADGGLRGRRVGDELEHAGEARQAQHAQRVVVERGRRAEAQAARRQVVEAAERIDDVVAVERPRQRVHGDVTRPEVRLQAEGARLRVRRTAGRTAAQSGDVDVQVADHDAPGAEDVRGRVDAPAEAVGEGPRERLRLAVEGDVDVAHAAPEELVAQAAADEPAGLPRTQRGESGSGDLVGGRQGGGVAGHGRQAAGDSPR